MKKSLLIIIGLTLFSCNVNKNKDSILYLIPDSVTQILKKKIDGNYNNIYFHLSRKKDEFYIYYYYINKNDGDFYLVKNSKRSLLIDDKLYPLIFDYDEIFGITDSYDEILEKMKKDKYITINHSTTIYEGWVIIFNQKGEILSE